jgi:hypothetical protein
VKKAASSSGRAEGVHRQRLDVVLRRSKKAEAVNVMGWSEPPLALEILQATNSTLFDIVNPASKLSQ